MEESVLRTSQHWSQTPSLHTTCSLSNYKWGWTPLLFHGMAWYGNIQPCVSRVDFFFFNTLSVSFYIGHHIFTQALKLSQINSVSRRISEVFLDFCLFLFLIKRYQFLLIPFHVPPLEQLKAFFCFFFFVFNDNGELRYRSTWYWFETSFHSIDHLPVLVITLWM